MTTTIILFVLIAILAGGMLAMWNKLAETKGDVADLSKAQAKYKALTLAEKNARINGYNYLLADIVNRHEKTDKEIADIRERMDKYLEFPQPKEEPKTDNAVD